MITAANWNGALALIVLGAIILTVLVSPLLLALFRRSVGRAMRERTRPPTAPGTEAIPRTTRSDAPRIEIVDDAGTLSSGGPLRSRLTRRRAGAAAIYALGGIVYALITTYAIASDTTDWGVHRFLAVFFLMAIWPAVPVVATVLVPQANRRLLLLAAVAALQIGIGQSLVAGFGIAWLFYAGVPTALFLVVQNRKLRTIVPLIITFALLAGIGEQVSIEILGRVLGGSWEHSPRTRRRALRFRSFHAKACYRPLGNTCYDLHI